MKTIEDLTIYFGKYLSNPEFEKFREENLINPTKYNSLDLFIRCKSSKMELCFTNERELREIDADKLLKGGKPIFTHFFIYPTKEINFEKLPYGVTFKDDLREIERKCGEPSENKRIHNKIFGNITRLFYQNGNLKIDFTIDMDKDKLTQICVGQVKKQITENNELSK